MQAEKGGTIGSSAQIRVRPTSARATTPRTHNKGGLNMRTCLTSPVVWCLAALVLVLGVALTVTAQQAPAPIQVAWAGPLTGDVAQLGQGYLNGIKLAFDEWNAKGGVLGGRKFVGGAEDDAGDPKQAGTGAQKNADDPKDQGVTGRNRERNDVSEPA